MIKAKRIIALVLVSLLCLSLCSCKELDELRATHAIWQEDGTVLWNGVTYRPVPDYTNVDEYELALGDRDMEYLHITEPDVPTFLSDVFCTTVYLYNDHTCFLASHPGSAEEKSVYWHEDDYGNAVEELDRLAKEYEEQYNVDTYYYECRTETQERFTYYLTEEQKAAIDTVLNTVEPVRSVDGLVQSGDVALNACNAKQERLESVGILCITPDYTYYMRGVYGMEEGIYWVPEELYPIMDTIFEPLWIENEIDPMYWPLRNEA